jgi:hypothetical protein
MRGGAVELSTSKDKRAPELERRVVLSNTDRHPMFRLDAATGTGLTTNSWYASFI